MIGIRRSIPSSTSAWISAGFLVLSLCAAARAEGDAEEAKLHFDRAQTAYKLGNYEEAIGGYEAAYEALPEPAFLFNIAQAHRQQYLVDKKTGHLQRALALYRTYLREANTTASKHGSSSHVWGKAVKLSEVNTVVTVHSDDGNKDSVGASRQPHARWRVAP